MNQKCDMDFRTLKGQLLASDRIKALIMHAWTQYGKSFFTKMEIHSFNS